MGPAIAQPLLERASELSALVCALDAARAGRGSLVVIEGAAGLGKSALVAEARRRADSSGMAALSATGAELERELPFGVALQLFERRIALASPVERERLLRGAAALARPLCGSDLAPERLLAAEPQALTLCHGLYWLAANLAERSPLLLAVDDAHWADPLSLRFLAYLAQRLEDLPIAVVVALRPREPGAPHELLSRLTAANSAETLTLEPLSPRAVEALVRGRFPHADEALGAACVEATRGNPLFVGELLRTFEQRGGAPPAAAVASSMPDVAITDVVLRSVTQRLANLAPEASGLARAVAVLEKDVGLRLAAALARLDVERAAAAADALADAEILCPVEPLNFVHPLVRAAIDQQLPAARRAGMHMRAARLLARDGLAPERVASHLMVARAEGSGWAVGILRAAAARASAEGAPATAAAYLRRALAEPPSPGDRGGLLAELARAELAAGEPAAAERFAAAMALADEPRERAQLAVPLAEALYVIGRPRDAATALDQAMAELSDKDDDLRLSLQATWLTISRADASMRAQVPARAQLVVDRPAGELTHAERVVLCQMASELVFAGEPRARACDLARRALADGVLLETETSDGVHWWTAAAALGWADFLDEFELWFQRGMDDARRRGSVTAFATCSYGLSYSHYFTGRLAEAIADAQQALDARRYGWQMHVEACAGQLAWALIDRGDTTAASATLADIEDNEASHQTPAWTMILEARARLLLIQGRPREAYEKLRDSGARVQAMNLPNPALLPWRSGAALAAARLGELDEARALASEEVRLASRFGAPRPVGIALRARGLIERGDTAIETLREAVATLERSQATLELARARIDFGAALRRQGHRREARGPLREGLDMAHRFGAAPLEHQARTELAAAGAKPRRATLSGAASLTPSELRVASMAADGLSNREIAEALFVTVKAVQWHLTNAYRKLDVPSRDRLREALSPHASPTMG